MDENKKDIELLHRDPGNLILKYQEGINIIVQIHTINKGFYNMDDKEELVQEVNLGLLESIDSIKKNYKEKCLLKTYVLGISKNICYDILRKKRRNPAFTELADDIENRYGHIDLNFFRQELADEFEKFSAILKTYFRKQAKIELCLQILYRIPVKLQYFIDYCRKKAEEFYNTVLAQIPVQSNFTDKEIYGVITPYINECDNKENTVGAAQRWMNKIIDQLIVLMNTGRQDGNYNKEIFQILVEKYYQKNGN